MSGSTPTRPIGGVTKPTTLMVPCGKEAMVPGGKATTTSEKYPHLDDKQLFQIARLVTSAVIAKIHTIDRTPELLKMDTESWYVGKLEQKHTTLAQPSCMDGQNIATGRGFVVRYEKFTENYMMYSRSHFVKALELMMLLIVYQIYDSLQLTLSHYFISCSLWFLVVSWLFVHLLFNSSSFEWQKIVGDWDDWSNCINSRGIIRVLATKS